MTVAYDEFLRAKAPLAADSGFPDVDGAQLHPVLKPHQRDIVAWALRGGQRAIFAAFGLGKSVMQLELMRQISDREQAPCLIICPLGVRQEFTRDAALLDTTVTFIRRAAEREITAPTLFDLTQVGETA